MAARNFFGNQNKAANGNLFFIIMVAKLASLNYLINFVKEENRLALAAM